MMSDRPRGDALIHLLGWFRLLQQVVLALPMNVSVPRRRDATVRIRLEVPGITGIRITAQIGQIIAPPPDGASYLGFIFSRCANSAEAEMALRLAHATLLFDIQPEYKVQESISEH